MNDLSSVYGHVLLAQLVDNPASQELAFRLRHQVYCKERGFEPDDSFPDGLERDEHDDRALQILVRNRLCGSPLGVSRVVLDDPGAQRSLPVETHGCTAVRERLARLRAMEYVQLAEISRFAVTRNLNRVVESQQDVGSAHVSMGVIAMIFAQSWRYGVTHWVGLLDASLPRFLRRLGITCQPIGSVIEFRGTRQPVLADLRDVWQGVARRNPDLIRLAERFANESPLPMSQATAHAAAN
ncbi:PEP-CTERM/exosortase system-associated acyltransferase [Aquisalimonas lutea]|uniref:PEP-CTERM/exosortase system-associated acyltransferase n=1 Tax=Aquisalimonas lutea TaxID=1327750 RepID=UPI0025B4C3B0|nr:PEP-CTERM/exosortase system-associated acyltransferase [Aquisalimonas lutea]MDN3517175.1 PEP-CTERM/exosortase system-associated acyltransferase [Aquisalimonas lutea]